MGINTSTNSFSIQRDETSTNAASLPCLPLSEQYSLREASSLRHDTAIWLVNSTNVLWNTVNKWGVATDRNDRMEKQQWSTSSTHMLGFRVSALPPVPVDPASFCVSSNSNC